MLTTIAVLSWIGVVLTGSILLPQIIKSLKTKSTKDISWVFPLVNLSSNIFWIVATSLQLSLGLNQEMGYALIAVNVISGLCASTLLTYKFIVEKTKLTSRKNKTITNTEEIKNGNI